MRKLVLKSACACFTGHRKISSDAAPRLRELLRQTVLSLYGRGVRLYHCGMAIGFDMLAAEVLLELKAEYPDIQLIAVVPFRHQYIRYSDTDRKRYFHLLHQSDRQIMLREEYSARCYLDRNDYMLRHSSHVIAYFDGQHKGGTFYTYSRAVSRRLEVVNLY